MQVSRASGLLSLVAFSGLVAGPAWAGQVFDKMTQRQDKGDNPEARRQPPKYYRMQAEEPCGTA